ncbi:MAG: hypothetical protein AMK69_01465 [Nitrospira bacterium SG8_3]|nr:MAG: hypothetical protein AMK69_01465 [Nitrospira bacterium SG8_3]
MSQFDESVIPGEQNDVERDPESRKVAEDQAILDPGSHPASVFAEASPDRPRDLAGMTNYGTTSRGGGHLLLKSYMHRPPAEQERRTGGFYEIASSRLNRDSQ